MAEQGVAREPPIENPLYNLDLIDSLAGVDSFPVEVLICIGNCPGVNIEASLTGVDGCKSRARSTLYAYPHARLKDAVSRDDDVLLGIYDCRIQRMSQGSDHPLRRPAWELGIGIESDYEANAREYAKIADLHGEAVGLT